VTDEGNKDADDVQEPGGDPEAELTVDDILAAASDDGQAADDAVAVLQSTVEERTRDLQRITAEFQNYRKRVERDKARSGELATAAVLQSLLPVLDDMDRAREHGDLNGPFGSVAEQLVNALAKHGLESFGTKGDAFDPQIHEAVAHMQMPGVDGPTCIDVMRSGYRLGDKLLRPALVAVAEPGDDVEPVAAEADPEAEDALESEAPEAEASDAASEGDESEETAEEEAVAAAEGEGMTDVEPGEAAEGKTKKKKDKGDKDS
jgi:molecular chaperone GrpE